MPTATMTSGATGTPGAAGSAVTPANLNAGFSFMNGEGYSNQGTPYAAPGATSLSTSPNYTPPNTSQPVSSSLLQTGPLSLPVTKPSGIDPTALVNSTGSAMPQGSSNSSTPAIDAATGLGSAINSYDTLYNATLSPSQAQDQQNIDNATSAYQQLGSQLGNKAADTASVYNQGGANSVNSQFNNIQQLNTQLQQLTSQYNLAYTNTEANGINSGTPAVIYQGQQAAIQRQQAAVVGAKAAELAAAQQNYTLAKQYADQAVSLKYQDIQDKINNTLQFLQINRDNLTAAEKIQADKIAYVTQQQQIQLDNQKQAYALQLQYPNAGIAPTDNLASATQKASAWLAQNPYAGQKPVVIGHHIDSNGNNVETYGLVGSNGQIQPLSYDSSSGNTNFGMSVGTMLGLPTYNTQANNPGVSRPTRNNNPFNLKASATTVQLPGVVGIESTPAADGGNFLIFSDPQSAIKAAIQFASTSSAYAGMTAGQAIKKWNGGGAYSAADIGLDPNKDFQSQLKDPTIAAQVASKWAQAEGFNNSTTSAIGTTGSQTIDSTSPDYSTKIVGGTGVTQAAIDQAALSYALTGKMPSLGNGSTGQVKLQKQAIQNRAGELNAGGNIQANKAQLEALNSSLTQQTEYQNTVQRSLANAEVGFQQITSAFSSASINTSESSFLNSKANDAAKFFGNNTAQLRAFQAGLQEVSNEYQQVFSRGGQVTDTVRNKANDIFDGNISIKDLFAIQNELQQQGQIVNAGSQAQIQSIQDKINSIINPGGKTNGGAQVLTGPDGKQYNVPADQVDAFIKAGGHR